MPRPATTITHPPHMTAAGPAAFAQSLAEWAGDDAAKLAGAFLAGNGRTQAAFLRRVSIANLHALREVLASREPLPFSTQPFGVFEVDREIRRRS